MPASGTATVELPASHPLHLFTVDEAAELLQLSPATVHRLCKNNRIPHRNIVGTGRRFARADLERIIRDGYRGPR
jgi:excisionase family DNA binding protein